MAQFTNLLHVSACKLGWTTYTHPSGRISCFKEFLEPFTYEEAICKCHHQNATLPVVNTSHIANFLHHQYPG